MTEQMDQTSSFVPPTEAAVRALVEIAWMARRTASNRGPLGAQRFNEAQWLLVRFADQFNVRLGQPDPTANRDYVSEDGITITETPSNYADGAPVDFTPEPHRAEGLADLPEALAFGWVVNTIHELAHVYADGRATYATSTFNNATRVLRAAGFPLTRTQEDRGTVWVRDGMGDAYTGLSAEERAERDRAYA